MTKKTLKKILSFLLPLICAYGYYRSILVMCDGWNEHKLMLVVLAAGINLVCVLFAAALFAGSLVKHVDRQIVHYIELRSAVGKTVDKTRSAPIAHDLKGQRRGRIQAPKAP